MYPAGTTLKLDFGTFFHYGIADGEGNVIHNSKKHREVRSESYHEFAEGKRIIVSDISSENSSRAAIMAQRYIGLQYDLFISNCEHFVRLCHGLEKESTQIQQYLCIALGAGMAAQSKNDYIKAIGGATMIASALTPGEKSPFKNIAVGALIAVGIVAMASALS